MYDTKKNSEFDRLLKSRIQLFEGRAETGATEAARKRNETRRKKANKASLDYYYRNHDAELERNRRTSREWREKNPEKHREQVREWNEQNPELRREYNRKSYHKHAEERNLKAAIRRQEANPNAKLRGRNKRLYGSLEGMKKRLAEILEAKKKEAEGCTLNN